MYTACMWHRYNRPIITVIIFNWLLIIFLLFMNLSIVTCFYKIVYIGCLNHSWSDEILDCKNKLFAVFGKFAILDIWSVSSQHLNRVYIVWAHLVYIQHIWITVLYLLVFHPLYLHLYCCILYPVFMTNIIISVLQVYWVVPVWSISYSDFL